MICWYQCLNMWSVLYVEPEVFYHYNLTSLKLIFHLSNFVHATYEVLQSIQFWVIQEQITSEQLSGSMRITTILRTQIIKNEQNWFPFNFGEMFTSEWANMRVFSIYNHFLEKLSCWKWRCKNPESLYLKAHHCNKQWYLLCRKWNAAYKPF